MDSILRSLVYGHFSESLAGMSTIRAYGESDRFMAENAKYMDLEDRVRRHMLISSRFCTNSVLSRHTFSLVCVISKSSDYISDSPPEGVNSRWLAIRIDTLGAVMVLAVALMAANGVNGISPSQVYAPI